MKPIVVLVCMTLGLLAWPQAPSRAQSPGGTPHVWQTYTNVRFRYAICYPADLLKPLGESDNGDGQRFEGTHGAQLLVYGQYNVLNDSLATMLENTASRLAGPGGAVTYRVLQPDWFVVSGHQQRHVFYAKTLLVQDTIKSFELVYDRTDAPLYEPVIRHLVACFKSLPP